MSNLRHLLVKNIRIIFLDQLSNSGSLPRSSVRCLTLHLTDQSKIIINAKSCRFWLYSSVLKIAFFFTFKIPQIQSFVLFYIFYSLMDASFLIITKQIKYKLKASEQNSILFKISFPSARWSNHSFHCKKGLYEMPVKSPRSGQRQGSVLWLKIYVCDIILQGCILKSLTF